MAVTVERESPSMVLDEGDRIVGVGHDAEGRFAPLRGAVVWDAFPGSRPLFKPYYDVARRRAEPVEFVQFYDGNVARVRAVPRENGELELYWELLKHLDTLTLGSLVETLEESLELLDREELRTEVGRGGAALRLIEGGR